MSWPQSSDPYYLFNSSENNARRSYYGVNAVPNFRIDGNINGGSSYSSWNTMINNELNSVAQLDIQIYGEYNSSTRYTELEIVITATEPINYSNLKLRTVIAESNLYYAGPNGINWHHETFRDMIPNTSGTPFTITEGQTLVFNQSFTHSSSLNASNCDIIVFVQSDTGRRILQGGKEGLTTLRVRPYHLEPFSLILPQDNDTLHQCYPVFFWNSSADLDSSYAISYEVEVDTDTEFIDPILSGPLSDTTWATPVCLIDNQYYWRVRAFNDHAPNIYSAEVFSFWIKQFGRFRGTVTDEFDNPLENVFVELLGTGKYDSTDIDGYFIIDSVYSDTYSLEASIAGYEDTVITDIFHLPGDTTVVDIVLFEIPGCEYSPGDVNNSGSTNGLDVIYLVGFFKGGPPPPFICDCPIHGPIFASADANGSCSVNGLDVTYLVSYFKGNAELMYCSDCPPGG